MLTKFVEYNNIVLWKAMRTMARLEMVLKVNAVSRRISCRGIDSFSPNGVQKEAL